MSYIANVEYILPEPKPETEATTSWREYGHVPPRLERYRASVEYGIKKGWIKPNPNPPTEAQINSWIYDYNRPGGKNHK